MNSPRPVIEEAGQIVPDTQVPFNALDQAFMQAARRSGSTRFSFQLADRAFSVNVAGRALGQSIRRAFEHLDPAQHAEPHLTIDVWDQTEAGQPFMTAGRGESSGPAILLRTSGDGRYVGEERRQGSQWIDRRTNRIVGCTLSAEQRFLDERARPFHKLLSLWLQDQGIQFIHAGLVAVNGHGVLFAGHGGAGKSTSSIACLRAGFKYLGDDFIGLRQDEGGTFTGYGLFATCLLNEHHIKRFPDLLPYAHKAHQEGEDKVVLYLGDAFPSSLADRTPIAALVLPRVVDSDKTRFRPASRFEALMAVAPTSVMYLPRPNATAFHRLATLVEKVPAYWLELGRNVDDIPGCVERLAAASRP